MTEVLVVEVFATVAIRTGPLVAWGGSRLGRRFQRTGGDLGPGLLPPEDGALIAQLLNGLLQWLKTLLLGVPAEGLHYQTNIIRFREVGIWGIKVGLNTVFLILKYPKVRACAGPVSG
jgi:hypothetical protein